MWLMVNDKNHWTIPVCNVAAATLHTGIVHKFILVASTHITRNPSSRVLYLRNKLVIRLLRLSKSSSAMWVAAQISWERLVFFKSWDSLWFYYQGHLFFKSILRSALYIASLWNEISSYNVCPLEYVHHCNQYFFKVNTIVVFVNGTHPHSLCVIRTKKWCDVAILVRALGFKECNENIHWKILPLRKQRAYASFVAMIVVSLSMMSFTTDILSGWLYDKWK